MTPKTLLLLTMIVVLQALAGCASNPQIGGAPALEVVASGVLPLPVGTPPDETDRPYMLGPFDRLAVGLDIADESTTRELQVDSDGSLDFPYAGRLYVTGMTTSQLADSLTERLMSTYLQDPKVSVTLKDPQSRIMTIEGEVKQPGTYPVLGKMTLLKAMARAGGTSESAALDAVVVQRVVEGQHYIALYSLRAIRQGAYNDPEIFAGDVVVVNDSRARRLLRDAATFSPLLTAPIILLGQLTK